MLLRVFFFFVQSYSHSAYIDYDGTPFYPVPVCRPGPKVGHPRPHPPTKCTSLLPRELVNGGGGIAILGKEWWEREHQFVLHAAYGRLTHSFPASPPRMVVVGGVILFYFAYSLIYLARLCYGEHTLSLSCPPWSVKVETSRHCLPNKKSKRLQCQKIRYQTKCHKHLQCQFLAPVSHGNRPPVAIPVAPHPSPTNFHPIDMRGGGEATA